MFAADTRSSWHLFDLFGHPIYVHPFFLALIALFGLAGVRAQAGGIGQIIEGLAIWGPTLFGGILLHEIGHATALSRFGYGTSDIILHGFGGVTINRRRASAPPGRSIVISVAGPLASFALAVVSFGVYFLLGALSLPTSGAAGIAASFGLQFFYIMGVINTVWAIFNLLPINPLDGGHIVLHVLRGKYGNDRKAMMTTAKVSLGALGILVAATLVLPLLDPFLVMIIAAFFGYQNWQILQSGRGGGPPRGGRIGV